MALKVDLRPLKIGKSTERYTHDVEVYTVVFGYTWGCVLYVYQCTTIVGMCHCIWSSTHSITSGITFPPFVLAPRPIERPHPPLQSASMRNIRIQEGQEPGTWLQYVHTAHTVHTAIFITGVWLGTKNTHISEQRKTFIPQTLLERVATQEEVDAVTALATTPEKLATSLMAILFTKRQLAYGNCTPTKGRWNILEGDILTGIRRKCISCS